MKLTKSEIIDLLNAGYLDLFIDELKELAEYVGCSLKELVQWRYGWHPEHVAELLCQMNSDKFAKE